MHYNLGVRVDETERTEYNLICKYQYKKLGGNEDEDLRCSKQDRGRD